VAPKNTYKSVPHKMPPIAVIDKWAGRIATDHPHPPVTYKADQKLKYNVLLEHVWETLGIMNFQTVFRDSAFCWQFSVACGLIRGPFLEFPCPDSNCMGIIKGRWDESKSEKFPWLHICSPPSGLTSASGKQIQVCKTKTSPAVNTIFSKSKLSIYQILLLALLQLEKIPVIYASTMSLCNVGREAAVQGYSFMREIAARVMTNEYSGITQQLGGRGCRIQIDESHIFKAKYNKGERSAIQEMHMWVLGIWEEGTNNGLLFMVNKRNRRTLWPIIGRYVHRESLIITDGWKAYSGLGRYFYQHHLVNHSVGFINPATGSNTNTQEGRWNGLKRAIKSCRSVEMIQNYLHWYMYTQRFIKPLADKTVNGETVGGPGRRLQRFLKDASCVYPGFGRQGLELEDWPDLKSEEALELIPAFSYDKVTNEMLADLAGEGKYYPHVPVETPNEAYLNILAIDLESEDEGEDFDPSYAGSKNFK
jgi:ISXO2-like transposase domain